MANRLNWQAITSSVNITKYNIYRSIVGVESANDGPFVLSNGMNLLVSIDDGTNQDFTFLTGSFVNIAAATSEEIVSVINATITGGFAHVGESDSFYIRSNNPQGSVKINGGTANAVFGFTTLRRSEKSDYLKIAEVVHAPGVLEYIDNDGHVYDWYKISAIDNLGNESAQTIEKQAGPMRDPICVVYGTVQDATGYRLADQEVIAEIEYPPSVDGVTTTWVSKVPITTITLRDGTFELELLQRASYRVEIKSIEFSRIIKIPELTSANIFTLEFEKKDLENGGESFGY